jgi:hypothetical protein
MSWATRRLALTLGCLLAESTSMAATNTTADAAVLSEYQSTHLVVHWRANPDCGDAKSVAVLVQGLLGDQRTQQRQAHATFEISAVTQGFHVQLDFADDIRRGRRTFDVESCEAALDASTLVLAVVLEPNIHWETALARLAEFHAASAPASTLPRPILGERVHAVSNEPLEGSSVPEFSAQEPSAPVPPVQGTLTRPSSGSEPVASEAPDSSAPAPSPRPVENGIRNASRSFAQPTRAERSDAADVPISVSTVTRLHVASRVLVDTATLPSWSVGFIAGIGLDYASVFVEVSGLLLEPRDTSVPGDSARGASIQLVGGQVRLCSASRASSARFALRPCTTAILAAMVGDAFGGPSRHAAETYVAAAFGADAALRIRGDVSVTSGLDLVVPVRRVSVVFNDVDRALHRTPPALQASLGMLWSF